MTMDVAMGLVSPVSARGSERGGKGPQPDADGFDRALAGKPVKSMPQGKRDEETPQAPSPWTLGGYGDRLSLSMAREPSAGTADGDLGELLLVPLAKAPNAETADAAAPAQDASLIAEEPAQTPHAAALAAAQKDLQPKEGSASPAGQDTGEDAPAPRMAGPASENDSRNAARGREQAAAGRGAEAPAAADRQTARVETATARPATIAGQHHDTAAQQEQRPAQASQRPDPVRMEAARQAGTAQAADAAQPRVNVLGFSTSSAPVMPAQLAMPAQLSTTAAGVVAAIEAEPTWRAAAAEATASQRSQAPGSVSTLRIQLNPADLGMVTARLTATGTQLEIEIRVESNDARQKLANDSEAILKALRGVGYDVEKVTIQQQAQQGGSAGQQQGATGRDAFMQGQEQEKTGANAGGRDGQGSGNGAKTGHPDSGETPAARSGGGVYI